MATNTNATMQKPPNAATAAATGMAQSPVMGAPAPNSDIILFINPAFRQEFDTCAKLTEEHDVVSFDADLVQKLNNAETMTYSTSLRVPKGCMARAKMHPVFRRLLVQSMWLQQQPAMLRYKGKGQKIDAQTPVCSCANPPCTKSAVRFVGNPGFFTSKNMLVDPFCVPVCSDTACVLQAQQMSNTIHAQAQQQPASSVGPGPGQGQKSPFAIETNPALQSQMPNSVKSCNTCGSFERAYGGSAMVLKGCPLCGIAYYCSQQCQIQDWQRGHKDVCTNAKGGSAVARAAQQSAANSNATTKPAPATIPEEGAIGPVASAPAPAPAPMPKVAPSPAPAPMPFPVQAPAPAPAPAPMPVPQKKTTPQPQAAATPTYAGMPEVTQAMAGMSIPMPTYKMPEPEASLSSAPSVAMPTYKMPEPAVPMPGAYGAPPAFNTGANLKQPPAYGGAPAYGSAAPAYKAPPPAAGDGNTTGSGTGPSATATTTSAPVPKGRKKAE